jgi:dihydroorotate dehydrogenase
MALNPAALLFALPPERAHTVAMVALGRGLVPDLRRQLPDDPVQLWGLTFPNRVGLAAGFDKNADALPGLAKLGFGFLEVGTVTPRPQPGNPQPRLFRLTRDQAIINCLGFNNKGHAYVRARLEAVPDSVRARCRIGVNLGKNKDSSDAAADYAAGVTVFAALADYLVINISSPNTPGLRDLQGREALARLLDAVLVARSRACAGRITGQGTQRLTPLLLKVAPDLLPEDIADIAAVVRAAGIDGLVVSNTTVSRPDSLSSPQRAETGGLSGAPLTLLATERLRQFQAATQGKLPLVGVGGIMTPHDATARLAAGASLIQVYSGLIYGGMGFPGALVRGVAGTLASGRLASSQASSA